MRTSSKWVLGLFIAVVSVVSFNAGTFYPSVVDSRLEGLHEVTCDELIRTPNSYTGKQDLVCETVLQAEDDIGTVVHIWRR